MVVAVVALVPWNVPLSSPGPPTTDRLETDGQAEEPRLPPMLLMLLPLLPLLLLQSDMQSMDTDDRDDDVDDMDDDMDMGTAKDKDKEGATPIIGGNTLMALTRSGVARSAAMVVVVVVQAQVQVQVVVVVVVEAVARRDTPRMVDTIGDGR